ncbi:MAG: protein kinase [Myxococcales bacterium]|nr:protein kinase [Myxococcales bacterium]
MSETGAARPLTNASGAASGGRYRVEEELAHGAMGSVHRALDGATGTYVAFKRLTNRSERAARMFEREYHTLVGLQHPRIIEVYDYGIDVEGPFYTMELLDGADLRDISPLDFRRACSYLRDTASSLSLLHARRLLHRDLSPRNVRVTSDGRAKLIDFGALSSFGIPEVVVGTPPCVPPEALHYAALDQRADLYALGALGYWILTRRHAYGARDIAALPEAWSKTPPRPSEILRALSLDLPAIPQELDDLIMSMLTLNPLGRPAAASEVIDRLTRIAGLPPESDDVGARSYLLGVPSIGRERERERLTRRLDAALGGSGSCIVIDAVEGMGSTRLLSELVVQAQVLGALPVLVDGEQHRETFGVVHSLIDKLLAAAPGDALAAAAGHEALLARFSESFAHRLAVAPDQADLREAPGELRSRVQEALGEWLLALAVHRPLLIAVDNLQAIDDASGALLAALAGRAYGAGLLVVACQKGDEQEGNASSLRALRGAGASMVLRGLEREQVHLLVNLLFGNPKRSGRLATWMHRVTGGNPRACMELAEDLVARRIVRFLDGGWVLPSEIKDAELPASLSAILRARIERLPSPARRLGEALAIHRGEMALDLCLMLAEHEGIAEPYDALDALCQHAITANQGDSYQFVGPAVRQALLARLDPERRRGLHAQLGELLDRLLPPNASVEARLDVGFHLLQGGQEERGAERLAGAALELNYDGDAVVAAVPALRAALAVYDKLGRPLADRLQLLTPLTMAAYYSDRRLADEFGEQTRELYQQHLGVKLAERLRPFMGRRLSSLLSLAWTGIRFMTSKRLGGIAGLRQSVTHFVSCMIALTGVYTICLNPERARRYATSFEAFLVLGRNSGSSLAYRFGQLLAKLPEERVADVAEGCRQLLARFRDPRPIRDMPPETRVLIHGGILYAAGAMEVFRAGSRALEYADELDALGMKLYSMVADQLRTNYHAMRGEIELADQYRTRVEMHAVQAGSAWQVEIWVPSSMIVVCMLTQDSIGLRRVATQLERMAQEIPSLERHAQLARVEYDQLRGDFERSFSVSESILSATYDREYIGRSFTLTGRARALNRLGRHAEARAEIEPLVQGLRAEDRNVVGLYVEPMRELIHAIAGTGDYRAAMDYVRELLQYYAASQHPLVLGNLHASACAIALAAEDGPALVEHLSLMERYFHPTRNSALIAQCERVRRQAQRMLSGAAPTPAMASAADSGTDQTGGSAHSLLSHCHGAEERAQFALQILLNHVGGVEGFLFACDAEGALRLIAPQHGDEPPPALLERLRMELSGQGDSGGELKIAAGRTGRESLPPPMRFQVSWERFRTHRLATQLNGHPKVVGAFAVRVGESEQLREPQPQFLESVARSLYEAGDAGSGLHPVPYA